MLTIDLECGKSTTFLLKKENKELIKNIFSEALGSKIENIKLLSPEESAYDLCLHIDKLNYSDFNLLTMKLDRSARLFKEKISPYINMRCTDELESFFREIELEENDPE